MLWEKMRVVFLFLIAFNAAQACDINPKISDALCSAINAGDSSTYIPVRIVLSVPYFAPYSQAKLPDSSMTAREYEVFVLDSTRAFLTAHAWWLEDLRAKYNLHKAEKPEEALVPGALTIDGPVIDVSALPGAIPGIASETYIQAVEAYIIPVPISGTAQSQFPFDTTLILPLTPANGYSASASIPRYETELELKEAGHELSICPYDYTVNFALPKQPSYGPALISGVSCCEDFLPQPQCEGTAAYHLDSTEYVITQGTRALYLTVRDIRGDSFYVRFDTVSIWLNPGMVRVGSKSAPRFEVFQAGPSISIRWGNGMGATPATFSIYDVRGAMICRFDSDKLNRGGTLPLEIARLLRNGHYILEARWGVRKESRRFAFIRPE